jgi:hypothetical protein
VSPEWTSQFNTANKCNTTWNPHRSWMNHTELAFLRFISHSTTQSFPLQLRGRPHFDCSICFPSTLVTTFRRIIATGRYLSFKPPSHIGHPVLPHLSPAESWGESTERLRRFSMPAFFCSSKDDDDCFLLQLKHLFMRMLVMLQLHTLFSHKPKFP